MNLKRIITVMLATLFVFAGLNYLLTTNLNINFFSSAKQSIQRLLLNEEKPSLVLPKFDSVVDQDSAFPDHFQSDTGYFVLIKQDTVSKLAPSPTSAEFEKLYQTQRVSVVFEKKQTNNYDGVDRTWVFISNEKGDDYLGWVFKDELVFMSNFERFRTSQFYDFSYTKGEFTGNFKVKDNGIFRLNWKSEGGGLYLEGTDKGRLYIFENIIWAKKTNQDYLYEIFKLDETNHLHHEYKYRFDTIKLDIYSMPDADSAKEK